MKSFFKMLTTASLLALAGCQSVLDAPNQATLERQVDQQDPQWLAHLAQLEKIQTYTAGGQFGYIAKQPKERFSSRVQFQFNHAQDYRLYLSSTLSRQSLQLQRNTRGLTVSDNEGNSRTEQNIQALLKEMIGTSFPIDQFPDWLKGKPSGQEQYRINEQRLLSSLSYPLNGMLWQVNYVEYHQNHTPALPKLIVLENGNQTIKIRIDQWLF